MSEEDSLSESENSQEEEGDFDEFYRKEAAKFRSA